MKKITFDIMKEYGTAFPASRADYEIPDHIPDAQVEKYIHKKKAKNLTKNIAYTWTPIGWRKK